MSLSALEDLRHVRDEAEFLAARARTLCRADFLKDDLLRRGFARSVESWARPPTRWRMIFAPAIRTCRGG